MALMEPRQPSAEPSDWEAIEQVFAALESPLLGYALRLVGQISAAEDIVQEAFMKLHSQFDDVRDPKPWLYRTVHNLSLNHLRAAGKIVSLDLPPREGATQRAEAADPHLLPDEHLVRLEGLGLVRLSVETLDERARELIRLKFSEDLSYKEISLRTGLTVSNIGYLLHHALKAIAAELVKNGVAP
jgi:RNA polymerase sigma factor (sigma-70 family)